MKGNPAEPGDRATSKPTWWNASGCSATSAFFDVRCAGQSQPPKMHLMEMSKSTVAKQIGHAASAFEQRQTGHAPKSVTVVLSEDTLVITLRGALSPAETAVAKSPAGAAQMKEFHRQVFANSSDVLRQEIKRITGVDVCEATEEVETVTGAVMQMFASGTVVQVFMLADRVPADTWSGSVSGKQP
jgi:uncharacterized protein YbcI